MSKLAFKDYVGKLSTAKTTERALFVKKIAKECAVSECTVYRWISEKTKPSPLAIEKISEITQIPVSQLFS
jgi:predicted DNA-binding transcriptional regulator AlpA